MTNRPLRVFLCHSSNDKPVVRELYQKLHAEPWIQPWLDEEELYPGQDWNLEIEKAVEAADAIIVCLTKNSINKEGYVQRELRIVLDFADYKPEGTLYIMPVRLEECEPPRRLRAWQYADYFEGQRERGLERLLISLKRRAESLDLKVETPIPADLDTASIKKSASKENQNKNYGARVLIVDDMDFTREQYAKMLSDTLDVTVVGEAVNGKDAIVMFDRLKPDIVLMDTHMPVMDGISATKIIIKKHPSAKIIICSIHNNPEIIREAIIAGAKDYLEIPFDKTVLTDAIRHLIAQ